VFTVAVKRTKHVDLSKVQTSLRGAKKVKVGFPQGEADSDNIQKAIWSEFGTAGGASGGGWGGPVPERPFLRNAMRDNRNKYRDGMKTSAKKLLLGQTSLHTVLSKLGILAQGDVQESITSLSSPPNSPVTIELKGSSNPLIDSGEMRAAVTYKIGNF
jgi:HK97 gp10 family phage protein